jgi:hypothetical protein
VKLAREARSNSTTHRAAAQWPRHYRGQGECVHATICRFVTHSKGWHQFGADEPYARTSARFDQAADNYYSEMTLPDGRKVKYQLRFPDEAFAPAPTASPAGGLAPDGTTLGASASPSPSSLDTPLESGAIGDSAAVDTAASHTASRDAAHQGVPRRLAADRLAQGAGAIGPSTVDDRAAVSRTERRIGARPLRGPLVSRVASPCRADRPRVCVAAARTPTPASAAAHAAHGTRGLHRDPDGVFLCDATRLSGKNAEIQGNRITDLTK